MELAQEEENALREACRLTCERMNACLEQFSTFRTEGEVKAFLEKDVETAFDTIVASGKHAAEPHYDGGGPLERGFCVIDFGIKHKGLCADITRTVFLGTPSEKEKKTYYDLLKEHRRLLREVKPGRRLKQLHWTFVKRLGGKKKLFIHALGHGLGKEVHEKGSRRLKKNECITIEPGLYEKGSWGIRIEDDVMGSGEVLTRDVTHDLLTFDMVRTTQ